MRRRLRDWHGRQQVYGSDLYDLLRAARNWLIGIVLFVAIVVALAAWAVSDTTPSRARGETQSLPLEDLGGVQER